MRILKEGNDKTEYIFDCDICGCQFALTVAEFAKIDGWGVRCPCCDNLLGKKDAYKDITGRYSEENIKKQEEEVEWLKERKS